MGSVPGSLGFYADLPLDPYSKGKIPTQTRGGGRQRAESVRYGGWPANQVLQTCFSHPRLTMK